MSPLVRRLRSRAAGRDPESGTAVVEFVAASLLLLLPVLYLVLVLGRMQAA